jgi:regulator of protease activity HflC (stomatin/prohibitin superfamily)
MFKDSNAYNAGIKRIVFLEALKRDDRITAEGNDELANLLVAAQMYEDALDAEAKAEYDFMQRFEERFVDSWQR